MRALQFVEPGMPPEVREVPTPVAATGQVRVRITAAGVCHSDLHLMSLSAHQLASRSVTLPMTLGHEGVGTVEALGDGVEGLEVGTPVAIFGPQGCGRCYRCAQGHENHCSEAARLGIRPPGLGSPGTMAEYLIVGDPRHLVPLGDLDPAVSAPLTDAGLTPYSAIRGSLAKIEPGSAVLVIGVGGLGHTAIQVLRALTSAQVIAIDTDERKAELARDVGAHDFVLAGPDAESEVQQRLAGRALTAVFDFVVNTSTVELGTTLVSDLGDVVLVGLGEASVSVGPAGRLATNAAIRSTYWGSRSELFEVLDLARAGLVRVECEQFSLDEAADAYRAMRDGQLRGRAVVLP